MTEQLVTTRLMWRVVIALVLAALAGLWLGSMMLAIKGTGNTAGAVATALFGIAFISGALVTWAVDESVIR